MLKKLFSEKKLFSNAVVIIFFVFVKLLLHLFVIDEYGYNKAELYLIDSSQNLDWGFVENPPLLAFLLKISILLFGNSVAAIRIISLIVSASTIIVVGLIVNKIGGGRFALITALSSIVFTPVLLEVNHSLSVISLNQFFVTLIIFLFIKILVDRENKIWLLAGVITGIGFQNSYMMALFILSVFIGIVLTKQLKIKITKHLIIGAAFPFLIILPNIIWQLVQEFPSVDFFIAQYNSREFVNPINFFFTQFFELSAIQYLLLITGIFYLFLGSKLRAYKLFAFSYLIFIVFVIITRSELKNLTVFYPAMIAFGSAAFSFMIGNKKFLWLKYSFNSFVMPVYLILLPFALPVLPIDTYIKYSNKLSANFWKAESAERLKLPLHYAEMFGWEEMVKTVAATYNSLPEEEKKNCGIWAGNFGDAAAINLFGRKHNLPKAISGHNNYLLWCSEKKVFDTMIVFGVSLNKANQLFEEVEPVKIIYNKYSKVVELGIPIYLCKRQKIILEKFCDEIKNFDKSF